MVGYIYKITNKINGKAYIGKTTRTVQDRWKEHLYDSTKRRCEKRPLYRAIGKYGADSFTVETLEEVDLENLSEREMYWIDYFHTYSDGYNATSGGDGKILYDYDTIAKLLREGKKYREIAEIVGCCLDTVVFINKKYNISYVPEQEKYISVNQYDLDGNYIQSFSSCGEAARWLFENKYTCTPGSGAYHHVVEAVRGKRKTANGFIWKKK